MQPSASNVPACKEGAHDYNREDLVLPGTQGGSNSQALPAKLCESRYGPYE